MKPRTKGSIRNGKAESGDPIARCTRWETCAQPKVLGIAWDTSGGVEYSMCECVSVRGVHQPQTGASCFAFEN